MSGGGSAERLVLELARLLEPLAEAAKNTQPAGLIGLAEQAGLELEAWLTEDAQAALDAIAQTVETVYGSMLRPIVDSGQPPAVADLPGLEQAVRDVVAVFDELDGLALEVDADELVAVGARLLEFLVIRYLREHRRGLHDLLTLTGVIVEAEPDAAGAGPANLDLSRVPVLLSDPAEIIRQVYGWGGSDFRVYLLLWQLRSVLWALGIPVDFDHPEASDVTALGADPERDHPDAELLIPLLIAAQGGLSTVVGLSLVPLPDGGGDAGVAIVPFGGGQGSQTVALADRWSFRVAAAARATMDFGVAVRPSGVTIGGLGGATAPPSVDVEAVIEREDPVGEPRLLVGRAEGSRIETDTFGLAARFGYDGAADLLVALSLHGVRLHIEPPGEDGFLTSLLPADGAAAPFDVTVSWSSSRGLHFEGSSDLEVTLPEHLDLGPIKVSQISLELEPGEDGVFALTATGNIAAALGPVAATVEGLGLRASLALPAARDGNLGLLDFALELQPPAGVGLVVDSGAVAGGGYLFFDPDEGRYAGALQLEFLNGLALTAVGLLTTRMPDGSEGFSLLIIITADFPPVQLGFGFTLHGVGGLLGVNRSLAIDVLRAGLKHGTVDAIMSPEDPVANAPELISNLGEVFPPAGGRHVIGPMLQLGWGTPTVLSAQLGVVLSLPSPAELVVLGRLEMTLPTEDAPLVLVRMDAIGTFDLEEGSAAIDATLFDSRLLDYCLSGDMALRAGTGARPGFAVSVGGLHPAYQPPADFPDLDRLAISLGKGDNPRLRLEAYLALTANTAQVGARLDVYAEKHLGIAGVFSVSGWLGFDTLIEFSPFRFVARIEAGVTLKRDGEVLMGVDLRLRLAGPSPWHARGEATAKVLGVEYTVEFDAPFGREERHEIPPPDPFAELRDALTDTRNWGSELPPDTRALVSLADRDQQADAVKVHPLGRLVIRQRVVPLDIDVTRFGNYAFTVDLAEELNLPLPAGMPVPRPHRFDLTDVWLGEDTGEVPEPPVQAVREDFSPGQFFQMGEDEQVSAPAFEALTAGLEIGSDAVAGPPDGAAVEVTVAYDEIVLGGHHDLVEQPLGTSSLPAKLLAGAGGYGARRRGLLDRTGRAQFASKPLDIGLDDPGYEIAATADLARSDETGLKGRFATHAEASQALGDHVAKHPEAKELLQVVGEHEAVHQ